MAKQTMNGPAFDSAAIADAAGVAARQHDSRRAAAAGAACIAPFARATAGVLAGLLIAGAGDALAQADAKRGERLYEECRACHALEPGAHGVGPSLAGVIGRKAAALDTFRFSPALRRSNLTWTAQSLDAFVADPQKVVPANRMPYSGLPDAKDRADLIAYLLQAAK